MRKKPNLFRFSNYHLTDNRVNLSTKISRTATTLY